jgi:hypothetical protein
MLKIVQSLTIARSTFALAVLHGPPAQFVPASIVATRPAIPATTAER